MSGQGPGLATGVLSIAGRAGLAEEAGDDVGSVLIRLSRVLIVLRSRSIAHTMSRFPSRLPFPLVQLGEPM